MKLFDCVLRLEGSLLNQVPKTGITVAEIEVLRAIHGSDAVADIVPGTPANTKRTSAEERARLAEVYASPNLLTGNQHAKRKEMLTGLFGHERLPLPDDLADPAEDEGNGGVEATEEVVVPKAPIKRAKLAEPAFAD